MMICNEYCRPLCLQFYYLTMVKQLVLFPAHTSSQLVYLSNDCYFLTCSTCISKIQGQIINPLIGHTIKSWHSFITHTKYIPARSRMLPSCLTLHISFIISHTRTCICITHAMSTCMTNRRTEERKSNSF